MEEIASVHSVQQANGWQQHEHDKMYTNSVIWVTEDVTIKFFKEINLTFSFSLFPIQIPTCSVMMVLVCTSIPSCWEQSRGSWPAGSSCSRTNITKYQVGVGLYWYPDFIYNMYCTVLHCTLLQCIVTFPYVVRFWCFVFFYVKLRVNSALSLVIISPKINLFLSLQ